MKPFCAITAMQQCGILIPTIKILLQIFATLPITTAAAERSYSVCRRLKTYLRSTICEERLNDLAICSIHNYVAVSNDAVIDCFAQMHPRTLLSRNRNDKESSKARGAILLKQMQVTLVKSVLNLPIMAAWTCICAPCKICRKLLVFSSKANCLNSGSGTIDLTRAAGETISSNLFCQRLKFQANVSTETAIISKIQRTPVAPFRRIF